MAIEKQRKNISKAKSNPKPIKQKPKKQINSFEEYFQECIKRKTIPADTPSYLKKALKRALKEYQQGIKKQKSALDSFADKYTIDGEAKVIPIQYFVNKSTQLKYFFGSHGNIKVRLVLICLMEKQNLDKRKTIIIQDRAYFQSETQNRHKKCFLWSVLRYLHECQNPNPQKMNDLKQYENELNFKGIDFSVKLKDIKKFENQNPSVPGINVFSVSDNNKFYPLRMTQKDCKNTIDLFLFEQDGKSHYSLIKNLSRLFKSQITSRTNGLTHIAKNALLISPKRTFLRNTAHIVPPMKQLL